MTKAFVGNAVPTNADLVAEIRRCNELGNPSDSLCMMFYKIARHYFQTQWRKTHDFFLMEQVTEAMLLRAMEDCVDEYPNFKSTNAFAFVTVVVNRSFVQVLQEIEEEAEVAKYENTY